MMPVLPSRSDAHPLPGLALLQSRLASVSRGLELAMMGLAGILLVFLSVTLFLQVLYRYVIEAPLPWTEEAARFALVWFAMTTAAAVARRGLHFVFRWGTLVFPPRPRWWLRQAVTLSVVGLLVVMVVQSFAYLAIVANQTATATQINMQLPYAAIPVGLSCFLAVYLLDLADALLSLWTGSSLSAKEVQEEETYLRLTEAGDEGAAPPVVSAGPPR
jgi:TRAP-type transport system small permease protein